MQREVLVGVALTAVVLLAGCTGASGPGSPVPTEPTTATRTPTAEPTTATRAPTPLDSLPAPSRCLTDGAPQPEPVDGVEPSTYPEPPTDTSRAAVVGWVRSFETAYFRNEILASVGDDDMNLTGVSASAEVRAVNRTADGYTVRLSDFGASNYASGIHGDHWSDVGYVVTETHLVRVPLGDSDDPVRASAGTPVVDCR
jgi:hypothetical protein